MLRGEIRMTEYEVRDEELSDLLQITETGYLTDKMYDEKQALKKSIDMRLRK